MQMNRNKLGNEILDDKGKRIGSLYDKCAIGMPTAIEKIGCLVT
jgi:hypothetical protein